MAASDHLKSMQLTARTGFLGYTQARPVIGVRLFKSIRVIAPLMPSTVPHTHIYRLYNFWVMSVLACNSIGYFVSVSIRRRNRHFDDTRMFRVLRCVRLSHCLVGNVVSISVTNAIEVW